MGVRGRGLTIAVGVTAIVALSAFAAPAGAAITIGSNLAAAPDTTTQVCAFAMFTATDRPCTDMQLNLPPAKTAPGGLLAASDGVVVRWRVASGVATPGTTRVKLRLRTIHDEVGGEEGTLVNLPLAEPGIHAYAERLPVKQGDRIAVTALVSNFGDEPAGAPITAYGGASTEIVAREWVGTLPKGQTGTAESRPGRELLVNADIEPDADHDGFGDETQDGCPGNAGIQADCADRVAPAAKVASARRQDIVGKGFVKVRVSSTEAGAVAARGKLKIPSLGKSFQLRAGELPASAGRFVVLRLGLTKPALKAAKSALGAGRKVKAAITASAKDAAGNVSAGVTATVLAKDED